MSIPFAMNPMGLNRGGFRPLQCLKGTGTQWLDMGVVGDNNTEVEIDVSVANTAVGYIRLFGARNTGNVNAFAMVSWGSQSYAPVFGRSIPSVGALPYQYGRKIYKVSKDGFFIDGEKKFTFTAQAAFVTSGTMVLFSCKTSGNVQNPCVIADFYAVSVRENGVLIRDYVPMLCPAGRKYVDGNSGETVTAAADKPGMYDKVSKRLFVNQGTDEFLYE